MMSSAAACEVLGVRLDATAFEVRAAFRAKIRHLHPDVSGETDATSTRELLTAYQSALEATSLQPLGPTEDSPEDSPEEPSTPPEPSLPWAPDNDAIWMVDTDTIALACPHDEAFARLLDVATAIGSITYLDRQGELFEVLLRTKLGDTMSLVASFQGRAHWVEVFLTTEVLDIARHELPTIDQLTELVLHELRSRW